MCGKIKLVCFDKTGTLTEDSLDLLGVLPCTSHGSVYCSSTVCGMRVSAMCRFGPMTEDASLLPHEPLLYAMATCHSHSTMESITHTHTQTYLPTHTHTQTYLPTLTHTHTHRYTYPLTHTHTLTYLPTLTHTDIPTHSHTLTYLSSFSAWCQGIRSFL